VERQRRISVAVKGKSCVSRPPFASRPITIRFICVPRPRRRVPRRLPHEHLGRRIFIGQAPRLRMDHIFTGRGFVSGRPSDAPSPYRRPPSLHFASRL
jgi:hypothetical protein